MDLVPVPNHLPFSQTLRTEEAEVMDEVAEEDVVLVIAHIAPIVIAWATLETNAILSSDSLRDQHMSDFLRDQHM